jgi:hypothetical protein
MGSLLVNTVPNLGSHRGAHCYLRIVELDETMASERVLLCASLCCGAHAGG